MTQVLKAAFIHLKNLSQDIFKNISVFIFLSSTTLFGTVRIFTFHYNNPDFIEMQYKTLQKFLMDEYELIVFNDAATAQNERAIQEFCEQYGISCVRFQPEWHFSDSLNLYLQKCYEEPGVTNPLWAWADFSSMDFIAHHPSIRHSHVIQYALDHYGYDHDDIVVIMDGDSFLIQPTSIRELLGTNDIIGLSRKSDPYAMLRKQFLTEPASSIAMTWLPSVIFIAFNPSKLQNPRELQFHVDVISGHPAFPHNGIGDTGAAAYKYITKYPQLKIKQFYWLASDALLENCKPSQLKEIGFDHQLIEFIQNLLPDRVEFFAFEHFVHFGSVSFYKERNRKFQIFSEYINTILQDLRSNEPAQ